jgi:hypothetical protein
MRGGRDRPNRVGSEHVRPGERHTGGLPGTAQTPPDLRAGLTSRKVAECDDISVCLHPGEAHLLRDAVAVHRVHEAPDELLDHFTLPRPATPARKQPAPQTH